MKAPVFVLLVLLAASIASAQITPSISVSGRLSSASTGIGLSGSAEVVFRIFDDATAGIPLFEETKTVSLNGGLFSTTLAPNLPFNQDYWLELVVNSEALTPRQKLTPAPYAIYANQAGSLGNGVVTVLGSNTVAIAGNLSVAGDVRGTALCIGLDCRTSWSAASPWATSGNDIFYSTGNVGIGTAGPTEKLEVAGNVKTSGNIVAGGSVTASSFTRPDGSLIDRSFNCVQTGGTWVIGSLLPTGGSCVNVVPDTGCTTVATTSPGTFQCPAGTVMRGVTTPAGSCGTTGCFISGIRCCSVGATAIA